MPQQPKELRRLALAMGGVSLAGYAVDYGFNLGLTRFLTPHAYGDYKVAFSFAFFLGLAVLLGGDRAAPLMLSPAIQEGRPRKVWEYLLFYFKTASLLGGLAILLTWVLSALHVGGVDPEDHHVLAWAVVAVPLNAAAAMVSRTLQSAQLQVRASLPWRVGLPLFQLALFALVVAWRGQLTVYEAVFIAVVATAGLTWWQWRDIRRLGLVEVRRDRAASEPRVWLKASLPMMGAFLVALALNQSDLFFLELLGNENDVGHYAAAAMAAHFVPLLQVATVGLIAPFIRPALDRGAEASRTLFRQGLTLILASVLPVAAVLVLFAGPILGLFGPSYRDSLGTLIALVLGNVSWALAALSSLWLQYQRRGVVVLVVSILTLALDSLLNLLLIPRYGMEGAAASTAMTLSLSAAMILWLHWRHPSPSSSSVEKLESED
ncbi:MAG: oligosaccharide flippase family protein [Deltaproteobacteria bacterium]|nr:oligosaccharide flippase family protein [Deltaproteobacteria bacterium]